MDARLRYVEGDFLEANGVDLRRIPVTVEGGIRPLGQLDGVVIDVQERRVCSLVIATRKGARQILPLDVTCLNAEGALVISPQHAEASEPFDPSAFAHYDEDAMMSLLFGPTVAA